jgi:acetoacetyl-CoA synthetase
MDIVVVDEEGNPVGPDVQGELTCGKPFPSMPLGFWGDDNNER